MDENFGMREIRMLNRLNIVFNIILKRGQASKYEIKKESQFSMTTVISTIEDLERLGYIVQSGVGASTGGRRPVYYKINPMGGFFIGLEFNADSLHGVLIDLTGNVIMVEKQNVPPEDADIHKILNRLVDITKQLESRLSDKSKLFGIGIGAPGFVDIDAGKILFYSHLPGCSDIEVRSLFSEAFSVDVCIDNNINVMAYAYKDGSTRNDSNNLVLVSVRSGVGMGCLLQNTLYRGHTGAAGEIGHSRIPPSNTLCHCGKRGCLDAEVSNSAIIKKVRYQMSLHPQYLSEYRPEDINMDVFVKSVRENNTFSLMILDEVCFFLSEEITHLVNILNPQSIILSGPLCGCGDAFLSRIKQLVYQNSFPRNTDQLKITLTEFGSEIGAIGAAKLAFHQKFAPPDIADIVFNKYH